LEDYSITSPEVFLEAEARSSGLSLDECSVPRIVVIALRTESKRLVELTEAVERSWFSSTMYRCRVGSEEIGLVPWTAYGAPMMALMAEHLIACGAKTILFSGALGAFQPYMEEGDFVIPSKAIIGEGTSRYYYPRAKVIETDPEIREVLEKACRVVGARTFVGPIWDTDAVYREMRSKVEKLQSRGVLGVEMETSILCAVARFRGIKAGSLQRVSDSLASFRWEPYFRNEKYRRASLETTPKILIEALRLL
jgi:uridine phosphorylase